MRRLRPVVPVLRTAAVVWIGLRVVDALERSSQASLRQAAAIRDQEDRIARERALRESERDPVSTFEGLDLDYSSIKVELPRRSR